MFGMFSHLITGEMDCNDIYDQYDIQEKVSLQSIITQCVNSSVANLLSIVYMSRNKGQKLPPSVENAPSFQYCSLGNQKYICRTEEKNLNLFLHSY